MQLPESTLRQALVGSGIADAAAFDAVSADARRRGVRLDAALVDAGIIPDDYLGQLVAEQLGYPFAKLGVHEIPDHVLRVIPERVARRNRAIAFAAGARSLDVAMRDPGDLEFVRMLEKKTGLAVRPHYATEHAIAEAVEKYASDLGTVLRGLFEDNERDNAVVAAAMMLLQYAHRHSATDMHLEPRGSEAVIRCRIDGVLHDVVILPRHLLQPIIDQLKHQAGLAEGRREGRIIEEIEGHRLDFALTVLPVIDGEEAVLRLRSEKGRHLTFDELGLSAADAEKVRSHLRKSFGMVVVAGSAGSGRTATLYAALRMLGTPDVSIATVEDPVEYAVEGISQTQAEPDSAPAFAAGLRGVVRQDPDVIMVGEIRDESVAAIAVNAAMTGHLVLSSLFANDAATALLRFREFRVEPFLTASAVHCVIGQRLVRRICQRCIVSHDASLGELRAMGLSERVAASLLGDEHGTGRRLYHGKGCDRCDHTGYQGRVGVFEVMEVDDAVRDLLMKNANAAALTAAAAGRGMTTMFEDGVAKVRAGITTVEELLRVVG